MIDYPRHRRRVRVNGKGSVTYLYGGSWDVDWPTDKSDCYDTIGEKTDAHGLWIVHERYDKKVGIVSRKPPGALYTLHDYPFDNQGFSTAHTFAPIVPNDIATITTVQARTNPSKPEVSVPRMIAELRDIPSMVRLKGRKTIDGMPGNSVVQQNFGWNAMINDFNLMSHFTEQVDKRLKELEGLHSGKGLSRKSTVFEEAAVSQGPSQYFQSAYNSGVYGFITQVSKVKKWGTVNWIPNVPFKGTDGELKRQAGYLVHGWDFSGPAIASLIWELIPWSWFIDYFGNLGDYLNANRNGADAIATMGCVMEHRVTAQRQVVTWTDIYSDATPGAFTFETKSRVLASAGLTVQMPFLSAGQVVTLSALAQSLAG